MEGQLSEMHSSAEDTHNLVIATQHLADAATIQAKDTGDLVTAAKAQADAMKQLRQAGEEQAGALDKLRRAGEAQAGAMDKLRIAGEAQARASQNLAQAGAAQAAATAHLAENSARQLGAIQASADAAKLQAAAVQKQADATAIASKATDRLADAGQAQSKAVLQSLDVARAANDIASRTAIAADRAWVGIQMPVGDTEPSAGQDYKVDVNLSNSGRSPAINATAQIQISIVTLSDKAIQLVLDKCPEMGCQKMTVFPSGSGFGSTTLLYHPTIAAKSITPDQLKRLNATPALDIIVIRARVDYYDTYGNPHMTSSCYYFVSKLGFTSCTIGSYAN